MTTELEQEFYKVFGIEPIPIKSYGYWLIKGSIAENDKGEKVVYPEITDRKLLEMICIAMKYKNTYRFVNGIEDLKEQTLKILISIKDMLSIYAEIQQLFKEGKWNT